MRKHLFAKFLTLLLSGAMLVSVGCKDYDDDIDNLNNRLDQLTTGTVASLAEQVKSLESSVTSLKSMDTQLDTAIKALQGALTKAEADLKAEIKALKDALDQAKGDIGANTGAIAALKTRVASLESAVETLKTRITALETAKTDLQKQIDAIKTTLDTMASKSYVDQAIATLNTTYAQISTVTALQGELNDLKSVVDELKAMVEGLDIPEMDDINNAINTAADKALADAKAAMGPAITAALGEYTNSAELAAKIQALIAEAGLATSEEAQAALAAALAAQADIDAILLTFEDDVNELVTSAIETNNALIDEKIATKISDATSQMKTDIDDLKLRVQALEDKVAMLQDRIQSLVYVPEYLDGHITFAGAQYFTWKNNEKFYLRTNENEGTQAVIKYRVSPASLAAKLVANKEALSVIAEEIFSSRTTDEAITFSIESVALDDAKAGTFTIIASTNYTFETVGKTLAVALHVDGSKFVAPAKSDINYTSDYVGCTINKSGSDQSNNFVVARNTAKAGETAVYEEYDQAKAQQEIIYNDLEKVVNFLEGYDVMYKIGDNIITLADAKVLNNWNVELPKVDIVAAKGAGTFTPDTYKANYTVVDGKSIKINKSVVGMIGNVYESPAITFQFKSGTLVKEVNTAAKQVVNITATEKTSHTKAPVEMVWNYQKYKTGNNAYKVDRIELDGTLSRDEFNALSANQSYTYTITDEDGESVSDVNFKTLYIYPQQMPGDAQIIMIRLQGANGQFMKSAAYNFTLICTSTAGNVTNIAMKVNFTGLPETVGAFAIDKIIDYTNGIAGLEVDADFGKKAYALVDPAKKFFADEAEFLDALKTQSPVLTSKVVTTVDKGATAQLVAGLENKVLNVTFANVDFVKQPSIVYNVDGGDNLTLLGVKIPLAGKVTLNNAKNVLLRGTACDGTEGNYFTNVTGAVEGNNYNLTGINLKDVFTASGAGVTVGYEFATPKGYTGAMPTLAADGVTMQWGACVLTSVNVTTTLRVNGVVADEKSFVAKVNAPVKYDTFKAKEGAVYIEAGKDANPKDLNIYSLMSMKDFRGTEMFNGTTSLLDWALSATGYGATVVIDSEKVKYEGTAQDFGRFHLSAAGVFSVDKNQAELAGTVTATVKVTITDKYTLTTDDKYTQAPQVKYVTVKFFKGAKPAK